MIQEQTNTGDTHKETPTKLAECCDLEAGPVFHHWVWVVSWLSGPLLQVTRESSGHGSSPGTAGFIPASILAEIWPKLVSNLAFYAQSTIAVTSGRQPKLRKRNKKHRYASKKSYSQDHKGTHIKSNASCCSFQFHVVPFVRKGHLHCQHSGPKWTSLLMLVFTCKAQYWLPFHIHSVWENANI